MTFDKLHFESQNVLDPDGSWTAPRLSIMNAYVDRFSSLLRPDLLALELGAGSCMLSLMLSKLVRFEKLHCVDISLRRMKVMSVQTAAAMQVDPAVLSFSEFDFSSPFPIVDSSFDLVLFDSALHHSRDMWTTLRECRRVLKPDGMLIASREQYLAPLAARYAVERLLRSSEVKDGVSENIYSRLQYEYYLRACGFSPKFLPVTHGKFKYISPLNGWLFSKWVIVARPS